MAVVKINAIEVPEGAGPELEKRFAGRAHAVENSPGFLGFQLLRPVKGENRYFVVTQWESEEAFEAWRDGPAREAHAGERQKPVASGASLLEFEVVLDVSAAADR
ncbi:MULTISPECIES: mycobilin-forming heme oxygenase MhuD [Rhodococcus]|jgi:heme-degrading monooxygenase HmoA|uniref:Antibiotic biosynthesis monooxygenase n=1 Tax=Rhodococcus oxybenzonivorans TaxID=1990687 RepID=A0A2S2BQB8_9NOCA|nr:MULTISPECIES: mycobilin-forming heme oxygenase MhuD [Rhodococcus]AWK70811.1 antibiotic biosynthesis monooxygenase [Rhodococcus oxybenzonivorans]MDV7246689.1 mycobilin-forming heme oxygenase MhuD [Rhodococcus oxybenzonivorans]MDV7265025.1 mycobilin-forming heme oxygenase MhuD [Rhodococcus oxybenzonivorans]MDV7278312.1 mycobilin-forming heme oxygenase MhuD [Rhodococcus oxybenzonivorans]MDV7337701.1 mycobilin-forming heme oxygenase MhuD [Rhodococcus oxybenzonivorans]